MADDFTHREVRALGGKRLHRLGLAPSYGLDEAGCAEALERIQYVFWNPRARKFTRPLREACRRDRERYVVAGGPTLARRLENGLGGAGRVDLWWAIAEWPLVFALMVTALGCVYRFAPDVRRRRPWITPGSVAATLLWVLASLGFKWYAGHFGEYQKTYGAIGGVIVALLWLYASGLAILVGAELNAAIDHESADRPSARPRSPA